MERFNPRGKLLRHLALKKPNKAWGTFKRSDYIENKPRSDFGAAKVNALESLSSEVTNILQSNPVQNQRKSPEYVIRKQFTEENNDMRNEFLQDQDDFAIRATKRFEEGEPIEENCNTETPYHANAKINTMKDNDDQVEEMERWKKNQQATEKEEENRNQN